MGILVFAFILQLSFISTSGLETVVYDQLKVVRGLHECTSNCSKGSISCNVEECSDPGTSSQTAQGLDVKDVYLELYTDPVESRNKLAVVVKWRPKANADISSTKGFLIDISNGETSYRRCYSISTPLTMDNTKDEFYNDCFGKMEGTAVKVGSTVTVNITSLPLDEDDPEYGKITLSLKIPDCMNDDLEFLEECERSGGVSTSKQCEANCDTFSNVEGVTYPISCTISKNTLGSAIEKCDPSNRTFSGTPSKPNRVKHGDEWYKFTDPDTGEVKVALNFSWTPNTDSSIKDLAGYRINVIPEGKSDLTNFNKCFTIHTDLTESEHKNAEFFYDCYGREPPTSVSPEESYTVSILSMIGSEEHESFSVHVPSCADPTMQDVTHCIKENERFISGQILFIVCENRTLVYSYNVSREYGKRAQLRFCEKGPLNCGTSLQYFEDLELSGTLYNLSLPSSANLTINYSIAVWGDHYPAEKNLSYTTLAVCTTVEPISVVALALTVVTVLIAITITAFFVWFIFYRHKHACGFLRRFQDVYWSPTERYPEDYTPSVKVPGTVKAYVAFSEDHALHKDVIHWFCTFLKHELGIDVRSSIWDENQASVNRARYIMDNILEADKVVIICSQGSRNCMDAPSNADMNSDMFSPVVNQACQNLLARNNPEKYVVAYFGYSTPKDIPELLREQQRLYSKSFDLMRQFEQFYFRLVGVEQYQDTGILKIKEIERYADASTRTDCGKKLHEAIEMMSSFVVANPTWYTTKDGSDRTELTTQTPLPTKNHNQGFENPTHNIDNLDDGSHTSIRPSISQMHPVPPPIVQNGNSTHRRPDERNTLLNLQCRNHLVESGHTAHDQPGNVHLYNETRVLQPGGKPQTQNEMTLSNRYPVESTAEWMSSKRQPLEHSEVPQNPQEDSVVMDSTGSSFEIPDTDIISSLPSGAASKPPAGQDKTSKLLPVEDPSHPMFRNHSFHADSFTTNDFATSDIDDQNYSHLMSNLPSNTTEMTTFGPETSTRLHEVQEKNKLIDDLLAPVRVPSTEDSPESGLFKLANLDEDEADLEDQIKSINISSNF